jgi:hypothetical protein
MCAHNKRLRSPRGFGQPEGLPPGSLRRQLLRTREALPTWECESHRYPPGAPLATVAGNARAPVIWLGASQRITGARMKVSTAVIVAATTAALAACNPPDANRTTNAPPGVNQPTAVMQPLVSPSAPPAPAMRTPVADSANTVAPGTDANVAFANDKDIAPGAPKTSHPAASNAQTLAVEAQEAAAKAPDTAQADAAKDQIEAKGLRTPGTGTETPANSPRHGTLTKEEESTQMPKAGQANNHSSTALEEDSGRGQKQ